MSNESTLDRLEMGQNIWVYSGSGLGIVRCLFLYHCRDAPGVMAVRVPNDSRAIYVGEGMVSLCWEDAKNRAVT